MHLLHSRAKTSRVPFFAKLIQNTGQIIVSAQSSTAEWQFMWASKNDSYTSFLYTNVMGKGSHLFCLCFSTADVLKPSWIETIEWWCCKMALGIS